MAPKPLVTPRQARAAAVRLKKRLTASGVPIQSMYLFGSYAKGTPREWSDIDIAVVSPQFGKDFTKESVLLNRIADEINPLFEVHPLTPRDLHDRWSTFSQEILKTGKRI